MAKVKIGDRVKIGLNYGTVERVRTTDAWVTGTWGGSFVPFANMTKLNGNGKKPAKSSKRKANPGNGNGSRSHLGKAQWDTDFKAGYRAGAAAYKRSPRAASSTTGQSAYKGAISRKHGLYWMEGYNAAIDATRGAYATSAARTAKALGIYDPHGTGNPGKKSTRSRTATKTKDRGKLIDEGLPSELAGAFTIAELRSSVSQMMAAARRYRAGGETRGAGIVEIRAKRFEDAIRLRQRRRKRSSKKKR